MDPETAFQFPSGIQSQGNASRQQQQTALLLLEKAERAYINGEVQASMEELQLMDGLSRRLRGHGLAQQDEGGGLWEGVKGVADSLTMGALTATNLMDEPTTLAAQRARDAGAIIGAIGSLAIPGAALFKGAKLLGLAGKSFDAAQKTITARNAVQNLGKGESLLRVAKNFVTGGKRAALLGGAQGAIAGASGAAKDQYGEYNSSDQIFGGAISGGLTGAGAGLLLGGGISAYKRSNLAAKVANPTAITPTAIIDEARLLPAGTGRPDISGGNRNFGPVAPKAQFQPGSTTRAATAPGGSKNPNGAIDDVLNQLLKPAPGAAKPFAEYDDLAVKLKGNKDLTVQMKRDIVHDILDQPNAAARKARAQEWLDQPITPSSYASRVFNKGESRVAGRREAFAINPKPKVEAPTFRSESKERIKKIEMNPDGTFSGASMGRLSKHNKVLSSLEKNTDLTTKQKAALVRSIEDLPSATARNKRYGEVLSKPITKERYKELMPGGDDVAATAENEGAEHIIKVSIKRKKTEDLIDSIISRAKKREGFHHTGEIPMSKAEKRIAEDLVTRLEKMKADPNSTEEMVNRARLMSAVNAKRSKRGIKDEADLINWPDPKPKTATKTKTATESKTSNAPKKATASDAPRVARSEVTELIDKYIGRAKKALADHESGAKALSDGDKADAEKLVVRFEKMKGNKNVNAAAVNRIRAEAATARSKRLANEGKGKKKVAQATVTPAKKAATAEDVGSEHGFKVVLKKTIGRNRG